MELKVICKRLIIPELDGTVTEGEYGADIVGITVPRYYGKHDLSLFSFRITSVAKSGNAIAEQVLITDGTTDDTIHLLWTVTSDFTAASGEVTLILAGVNQDNTVQIKFTSQPVSVNDDSRLEFIDSPTLIEQAYNQVQLEVQKAVNAAERAEKAADAGFKINPATEDSIGGVMVDGTTIVADKDGRISSICNYEEYVLPAATENILGGVRVDGTTITSSKNGVISVVGGSGADGNIVLPKASKETLGAVKVDGTTITANADGVISALNAANEYVLPAASEETLGGIKSGGDISVSTDGTVTVNSVGGNTLGKSVPEDAVFTDTVYTLPAASEDALGGVKSGDDISVSTDGTVTVNSVGGKTLGKSVPEDAVFTDTVYTLPAASAETLGGVKPDGTTITADESGVISAVASGGSPKITKLLSITKTQTESIAYTPNSPYTNYKYLIIKIDNNNKNTTTGMMIFERTAFTVGQSKTFPFVYDETAKQCYYYITFLANGNITIGANVTSCTIWGSNDIFTEI